MVLWDRHQPDPAMSVRPSVGDILRRHGSLELQSMERMYLNLYVPQLQHERGVVTFSGSIEDTSSRPKSAGITFLVSSDRANRFECWRPSLEASWDLPTT